MLPCSFLISLFTLFRESIQLAIYCSKLLSNYLRNIIKRVREKEEEETAQEEEKRPISCNNSNHNKGERNYDLYHDRETCKNKTASCQVNKCEDIKQRNRRRKASRYPVIFFLFLASSMYPSHSCFSFLNTSILEESNTSW